MLQRRKQIRGKKNNFMLESFENLDERDKLLKKYNLLKLTQGETENQNTCIAIGKSE